MKTLHLIAFLAAAPLPLCADDPAYSTIDRGPHHALWFREVTTLWPDGTRTQDPHYVVATETGMNFLQDGVWTESREAFEITPDGIAAATPPPTDKPSCG